MQCLTRYLKDIKDIFTSGILPMTMTILLAIYVTVLQGYILKIISQQMSIMISNF
jgi:hypothetical protein